MKSIQTLLMGLSLFGFAVAQEAECLETCIEEAVDVGAGLGCDAADFECYCQSQEVFGPVIVQCAYAECDGQGEIDQVEGYVSSACSVVGIPITVPVTPTESMSSEPTVMVTTSSMEVVPTAAAAGNMAPVGLAAAGLVAMIL